MIDNHANKNMKFHAFDACKAFLSDGITFVGKSNAYAYNPERVGNDGILNSTKLKLRAHKISTKKVSQSNYSFILLEFIQ